MTKQVPFQRVMRTARRLFLQEAERAQAAGANAPTTDAPTADAPTADAPTANMPTVSAPTVNVTNAPTMAVMPPILGPATFTSGAPSPAPLVAEDANDYRDHDPNEEEEEFTPLLEQGNEAGEMMESMDTCASNERDVPALLPGPTERILIDRCTSPLCPVPSTIPHARGVYLHDGHVNQRSEIYILGRSNPPPAVWLMVDRLNSGTAQPGDEEAVMAFLRNHSLPPGWCPII
ncbi:hypothetical protein MMC22_003867 [Lobaria immixta]|nr:hypothetical protein [Lobaria immixta]